VHLAIKQTRIGFAGVVGLALWLVSGIALNKISTVVNMAP